VNTADDPRVRLGELVERAAAHVDLEVACLGRKPLLVEQPRHLRDGFLVAYPRERRRAPDEVAAPGAAGLLGLLLAVGNPRNGAGQNGREQPVLVPHRGPLGAWSQHVEHPRPPGLPVRRRPRLDQAGLAEQAEVPAHGVLMQTETTGELANVVAAGRGA
jgi:hypothetical protein